MQPSLEKLFAEVLQIPLESVVDTLAYQDVQSWDSIGHMGLISAIEDEYKITIDTEDMMNIKTFNDAKTIIGKYIRFHKTDISIG